MLLELLNVLLGIVNVLFRLCLNCPKVHPSVCTVETLFELSQSMYCSDFV